MKKITKIETIKEMPKRLRVAAYARVSSGKDAMLNSLASQVNHYKSYIKSKAEWEFAGVYTDEDITGTKELRDEKYANAENEIVRDNLKMILAYYDKEYIKSREGEELGL